MMETILFRTVYFLIQAILLAIVFGSLWIVAKAKPRARVLMFIVAVGAIGLLGLSTGISANSHSERHRFEGEFARPQRMIMDHLSRLLAEKRHADAEECVRRLQEYELEFHPKRGAPHTNYMDIVMSLIENQQEK
ncbi:MAG: hypothetical protein GX608_00450 [Lentisphaerae bacterium]|nr:hypothetical protein [Lentisphaerota bacterium]